MDLTFTQMNILVDNIYDELVDIFAYDIEPNNEISEVKTMILNTRRDEIYSELLGHLTNYYYDPPEAKELWEHILEHKYLLSERLGRNIGMRFATLDYFSNILGIIVKPRVVDKSKFEVLFKEATTDSLTGLVNRHYYEKMILREIKRANRYKNTFCVVIFDIDNFKVINDKYGHSEGDKILKTVADIIKDNLRESDIAARWGGEEFIILMPETSKKMSLIVSDRIRKRITAYFSDYIVTVSGGIASFPIDAKTGKGLFDFADKALYRAKSGGKNQIYATPEERRLFNRTDCSYKVELKEKATNNRIVSKTTNISYDGFGFQYDVPLEAHSVYDGQIIGANTNIAFSGELIHSSMICSNYYEHGLQFTNISNKSIQTINNIFLM